MSAFTAWTHPLRRRAPLALVALLSACTAGGAYVVPDGIDTAQYQADLHDCRQLSGMERGAGRRAEIEAQCMGARGYGMRR